jgi:hypothetical protein
MCNLLLHVQQKVARGSLSGNQKLSAKLACYLETRMTVYGFAESVGPKAFTR